jgi:hypothetical protein
VSRAWRVKGIRPEKPVAENARKILAVRIGEFYSFTPIVEDESAIEALHDLRIAAKRLRYTLELFRPVFGTAGERQIERVRAIQEILGQLHDADVRIMLIHDELAQLAEEQDRQLGQTLAMAAPERLPSIISSALRPPPDDPRHGLLNLLGQEYAERRRLYEAFRATWKQFQVEGMRADLVALTTLNGFSVGEPGLTE